MGLFSSKKSSTPAGDDSDAFDVLADKQYREELREVGRQQFRRIIVAQAAHMEHEVDIMLQRVTADLKIHTARRVDALVGRLNAEVTNQINERIKEYNQVSGESQELVAQSLSRNAQMVHEKYQELSTSLQRAIANQEVMMATVFQDSKTQVSAIQSEQAKVLEQLRESEAATRREAEELTENLRQTVTAQASKLDAVYQENIASVETTRDRQAAMLENLSRTTKALETQYEQLSELLETSIAEQKTMIADTINDHMARIVEHYLIGALGEQSNLREQLPSIIQQMEENKQAMMDDMKL